MTTEEKRRYDREKSRRWRAANKDKVAQINKRYHKKNGHKYFKKNVDRTREWRQNNPVLARERRRRWEENRKKREAERDILKHSPEFAQAKKVYLREVRAKRKVMHGQPARKNRDLLTKSSIERLMLIRRLILSKTQSPKKD